MSAIGNLPGRTNGELETSTRLARENLQRLKAQRPPAIEPPIAQRDPAPKILSLLDLAFMQTGATQ